MTRAHAVLVTGGTDRCDRKFSAVYPCSLLIKRCQVLSPSMVRHTKQVHLPSLTLSRYQINGRDSIHSGIDILPLMLSYVGCESLSRPAYSQADAASASGVAAWITTVCPAAMQCHKTLIRVVKDHWALLAYTKLDAAANGCRLCIIVRL